MSPKRKKLAKVIPLHRACGDEFIDEYVTVLKRQAKEGFKPELIQGKICDSCLAFFAERMISDASGWLADLIAEKSSGERR